MEGERGGCYNGFSVTVQILDEANYASVCAHATGNKRKRKDEQIHTMIGQSAEEAVEDKGDDDTNSSWSSWNGPKVLKRILGKLEI